MESLNRSESTRAGAPGLVVKVCPAIGLASNVSAPGLAPLCDLAFGKRPAEELYALENDPHQLRNLAGGAEYEEVKQELSGELKEHLRTTDDPRILGGGEIFDRYPYYGGGRVRVPRASR